MVLTGRVTSIGLDYDDKKRITINFKEGGYIVFPLAESSVELGQEVSVEITITSNTQKEEN